MLRYTYREMTTIALVMLLLTWAFYLLDSVHTRWVEGRVRAHVSEQLVERGADLRTALNNRVSLLYGLRGFVEVDPSPARLRREFDHIAASLKGQCNGIRALQLVRDGVIEYTYPLAGNECVVGLDLLNDPRPSVQRTVREAMSREGVSLNGPLELAQGGSGIIARLPVRQGDRTWGLAAVVIDLKSLFVDAGITSRHGGLLVSARDTEHNIFFGDPDVFTEGASVQRIPLIDGYWEVAAVPAGGWASTVSDQVTAFRISGGIILLLLLTLFLVSTRSKYVLSRLVERRTAELQDLNSELQREVEARKRTETDLVAARDRAEQSDRLKDAFITTMSHEIRTPLHVILGYVDLLRAPDEEIRDEKEMFISSMKNAGNRLMRTVEEVLHISSLRTGTFKMQKQDVELVSAAKTVVRNYRDTAADRGLRLVFRSDLVRAQVQADRYSIDQVLTNLLENALKYTETGSVEVGVDGDETSCRITVKDSGIGMSAEYLNSAFDVFSQEQIGYNRRYDGLGLGLALTKRYVELHGGEITVHSEKGQGSEFCVTLPATATVKHGIPEMESTEVRATSQSPTLTLIHRSASVA